MRPAPLFSVLLLLLLPVTPGRAQSETLPPLEIGKPAPQFRLPYATRDAIFYRAQDALTLEKLRGQTVVLAFYPADWSPG